MSSSKVEGESYWETRDPMDGRRDWRNRGTDWIEEYVISAWHPHRALILDALKDLEVFYSVLEIGCSAGPNLYRIQKAFKSKFLVGIDINEASIKRARKFVPDAVFSVASMGDFRVADSNYDIGIADAVLMYADDKLCERAFSEFDRVIRKALIIVDWYDESKKGVVKDFHWARNYPEWCKKHGFPNVVSVPLSEKTWPHPTWIKNGRLFIAQRA